MSYPVSVLPPGVDTLPHIWSGPLGIMEAAAHVGLRVFAGFRFS